MKLRRWSAGLGHVYRIIFPRGLSRVFVTMARDVDRKVAQDKDWFPRAHELVYTDTARISLYEETRVVRIW